MTGMKRVVNKLLKYSKAEADSSAHALAERLILDAANTILAQQHERNGGNARAIDKKLLRGRYGFMVDGMGNLARAAYALSGQLNCIVEMQVPLLCIASTRCREAQLRKLAPKQIHGFKVEVRYHQPRCYTRKGGGLPIC